MKWTYNRLNNLVGWGVFIIAAITYLLTIEPNLSFWDCGEYIASASKLQVTHSPGAAFFQIMGAVVSILAFGDGSKYSVLINSMSALLSAMTILFLFWTITHLVRKVLFLNNEPKELSTYQIIMILMSGAIGALTFTFTDTFWFSAVEGEVYASASCFTALLVWLICKWENDANSPRANKWLVLISFILGISVGVHLMAILVVPAIGYLYYAKKYEFTWKSFLIASVVIAGIFGVVFKVIFPFTMSLFGDLEIFFVNNLNMPFNTGTIVAAIVLIGIFYYAITFTQKKGYKILNTIVLSVLFMLIGFSCWMMIPIRANANPPMNLNDPDNAIGMLDYYNRAQYGDWPVFYGANYTAFLDPDGIIGYNDNGPIYEKSDKDGKYIVTGRRLDYKFNPKHESILPRMYSSEKGYMENYGLMEGYPEVTLNSNPEISSNPEAVKAFDKFQQKKQSGNISINDYLAAKSQNLINVEKPSLKQNVNFLMTYQLGYMFIRYLFWNFVGKQNDFEGNYETTKGNWESGISFIDSFNTGNKDKFPDSFVNKGTNHYYFLPLILGLIGVFFQLNRDTTRFFALLSLFLLTSVGIILYTNIKAFEPRERDYALVSSFYAFSIWIGIGVTAIMYALSKMKQKSAQTIGVVAGCLLFIVPIIVGANNWDDHDRSRRYAAYDFSKSYLQDLDKNHPIMFVYGDNDTYPLWGLQETEQFRNDARVVNYTLLGTSWYIDQVYRKIYNAPAIPHSFKHEEYRDGANDELHVFSQQDWKDMFASMAQDSVAPDQLSEFIPYLTKDSMTAKEAIAFLRHKSPQKEAVTQMIYDKSYKECNILPVNKIVIPVNKINAVKYGIVKPEDAHLMKDYITVTIKGGRLDKAGIAMLDMLANYNWDRSIYFSSGGTYSPSNIFYLGNYTEYQGLYYKLVPIYTPTKDNGEDGRVNLNNIYKIVMNLKFGNFKDPKAYFDETCRGNIVNYRMSCGRAAIELARAGEKVKANNVLDLVEREIPLKMYPASRSYNTIISAYIINGNEKKAMELTNIYKKYLLDQLDYYLSLPVDQQKFSSDDMYQISSEYAMLINNLVETYESLNKKDKAIKMVDIGFKEIEKRLENMKMLGSLMASKNKINIAVLETTSQYLLQVLQPIDSNYTKDKFYQLQQNYKIFME